MDLAAEELELEAGGVRTGRQELEREDGRPEGTRVRGRWRKGVEVGGGWRKLEGGRPEGARGWEAGKARSTVVDLWELDREAGVCFLVSDANGRPAIAREGGRREGSGVRDGRGWPGRAGGSSSSSTAGLPLDGEELSFDFTI
jgi:hypothetical protein